MNNDQITFPQPKQRLNQPNIETIIEADSLSNLSPDWRKLTSADHKRWSRRYLLPPLKIICLLIGWTTLMIKRVVPIQLGSERFLNWLSQVFMKYFASPEAQEMLYRHFSVENALVHFVIQNSSATDITSFTLRPNSPEQLGDVAGTNATLLHDTIILNLFADLNKSVDADITTSKQPLDIDFSALNLPKFNICSNNPGRVVNLDFESCLYITVMVLTLCFTYRQIQNAVGSLSLDENLMKCLAILTGDNTFRFWTVSAPSSHVHIPLNPADYLHKHIIIHEYAFFRLKQLQLQQPQDL
jgi:hypothetical protein